MANQKFISDLSAAEVKPAAYQSAYQNTIDTLLDRISQKNADGYNELYSGFRKNYSDLAATGAQNAVADTEALSGGYGTTYGADAAAQQNQQYLNQMQAYIPDLYEAAQERYQAEQEDLQNTFSAINGENSRQLSQYQDSLSDWQNERAYQQKKVQDSEEQEQWQAEQDYQKERDEAEDSQWEKEFNENVREFNLDYALSKLTGSSSSSSSGSSGRSYSSSSSTSTSKTAAQTVASNVSQYARGNVSKSDVTKYVVAQAVKNKLTESQTAAILSKGWSQVTSRVNGDAHSSDASLETASKYDSVKNSVTSSTKKTTSYTKSTR